MVWYIVIGFVAGVMPGFFMGKRAGKYELLINAKGRWGRPGPLTLIEGKSNKQKDWRSLKG